MSEQLELALGRLAPELGRLGRRGRVEWVVRAQQARGGYAKARGRALCAVDSVACDQAAVIGCTATRRHLEAVEVAGDLHERALLCRQRCLQLTNVDAVHDRDRQRGAASLLAFAGGTITQRAPRDVLKSSGRPPPLPIDVPETPESRPLMCQ